VRNHRGDDREVAGAEAPALVADPGLRVPGDSSALSVCSASRLPGSISKYTTALWPDPAHLLIGNVTRTRVRSGSLSNQPRISSSSLVLVVSISLLV
jgi:hypothetical protein